MRAIFPRMVIYHLVLFIWSSSAGDIDSVAMPIHIMTISHLIRRSHAFVSCVSQHFLQFEIYSYNDHLLEEEGTLVVNVWVQRVRAYVSITQPLLWSVAQRCAVNWGACGPERVSAGWFKKTKTRIKTYRQRQNVGIFHKNIHYIHAT